MEDNKMYAYKIGKLLLGPIYKLWFNPKVYGRENIPEEGPVIIAGNHVHIMDQCNMIISTKRCIHYMAKKEYFDSKYREGKFAWFFKSTGCIPVDREKKDENAKNAALEVLRNGEVLGIFPEGTRNKIKESRIKELYEMYAEDTMEYEEFFKKMQKNKTSLIDYLEYLKDMKFITKDEFLDNIFDADGFLRDMLLNHRLTYDEYYEHSLLPLKYGAVSMAHKTNAVIVPYAITGKYKFRSKDLTITFGKPFAPDDDLEKANQKLDYEIKGLMKENELK